MTDLGQINPGQVIDGKYKIVRLLGTGGMGAVYEGENVRIRRKVAIKMLHLSVSTQADVVLRFEREAQASALVGSEHICEVLDLGVLADGTRYMVMEYLDGETLSSRIKIQTQPASSTHQRLDVGDQTRTQYTGLRWGRIDVKETDDVGFLTQRRRRRTRRRRREARQQARH